MSVQEDLVEKGFQLAWFLYPDRQIAISILTGALNKLHVQHGLEARRSYWRDKHLKRRITRITREEADALQWLICFESEAYEKDQEQRHGASLHLLAIRYVKTLVRVTTAMSSFHVNVGLQRLVYSYSTEEAQRFYEALTERYLGGDEYRRAKAALMQKLQQRFGALLETVRGQHGELRFAPCEAQEKWVDLSRRCLDFLTPWSTSGACPIPSDFGAHGSKLPAQLSVRSGQSTDADRIEINRCHAFIDPTCFGRLAEALALDAPLRKLALPRFNMPQETDMSGPPSPSPLSEVERDQINHQLKQESSRRRNSAPNALRVRLDGVDVKTIGVQTRAEIALPLGEGAELIEVVTSDPEGQLLLGVYPVAYDEQGAFLPTELALNTARGILKLQVTPDATTATATLSLSFAPQSGILAGVFSNREHPRAFLPKFVLPTLALALGFFIGRYPAVREHRSTAAEPSVSRSQASQPVTAAAAPQKAPASVSLLPDAPAYSVRLVPDELATRSAGSGATRRVLLPEQQSVIHFQLPIALAGKQGRFAVSLKTFLGQEQLLEVSSLRPSGSADHPVLQVPVPSELLHGGEDYSLVLRTRTGSQWEDLSSYTFHVEAAPQP
ncbi:MAG TPA: hypothetical protein VE783_08645 [Candidatus Limnocylindrales bacterium]|nr:hypothetical protein [Candidatus Limnocylindrales bacterium]